MKKIIFACFFFLLSISSIAQSNDEKDFKITFYFNDYRVCDLEGNSHFYLFYVDSNNIYRLDTVNINKQKININFDFEHNESLAIIFQYKKYILMFEEDIEEIFTKNRDNKLTFRIAKKNNYKKHIRKSYSKRKQNNRLLHIKDVDVSCNGYVGGPQVFSRYFRNPKNEHFKRIGFSFGERKYNKYIQLSFPVGEGKIVSSNYIGYKNQNKFFNNYQKLFTQILSVVGKEKSYIEPSLIHTLEVKNL